MYHKRKKVLGLILTLSIALMHTQTVEASEVKPNNCQITITADVPEEFGLSMYAVLIDIDTGDTYNISVLRPNGYTNYIEVPAGNYKLVEKSVYEDYAGDFLLESDVSIINAKAGQNYTVILSLQNKHEINDAINLRLEETGIDSQEEIDKIVTPELEPKEVIQNKNFSTQAETDKLSRNKEYSWLIYVSVTLVFLIIVVYMLFRKHNNDRKFDDYNIIA